MVFFCFIWFSVLYFSAFKFAKQSSIFSPLKFVCIRYALTNLPFILYIALYPDAFSGKILKVCNVTLHEAFLQYTIVQTIAFISLVVGIMAASKKNLSSSEYYTNTPKLKRQGYIASVFFLIGLTAYTIFLNNIGGLGYLLNNLDKRIALQSGQYILVLLPFMVYGSVIQLHTIKINSGTLNKILFALYCCTALFVFSSFGARKSSIIFILTLVIAYHFLVKPIKITLKTGIVIGLVSVFLVVYVLVVPAIRSNSTYAQSSYENGNGLKKAMYQTSYTYIDVFAANYFTHKNAWYLDGFIEPFTTAVSIKDVTKRAQVDQGVYFNSIVKDNENYRPPIPREQLSVTSWPTENFGFAYANFLLPGIVVFFFLQGLVFSLVYNWLKTKSYNPIILVLYVAVLIDFNFSSLRIATFIRILPVFIFAYLLYRVSHSKSIFKPKSI